MTEMALAGTRTVDLVSDAARARVRARYRAETRFRLYGLTAIGLTALFVVVVLADIFIKGLPAFTQYSLRLDVPITAEDIDPQNTRDPKVIRTGDFQAVVRNAFRAQFPHVTSRPDRRLLDGILSSGAADFVRDRVAADPALIGQTVKLPLLLSDDADLYYKSGTKILHHPGRGTATPTGTSGEITVTSTSDDFATDLATVKKAVSAKAREVRREADRLRTIVRSSAARKERLERTAGNSPVVQGQLAEVTNEVQSLSQAVKELDEKAAALQACFEASAAEEVLDENVPSLLVEINGGLVKITQMTAAKIIGTALLPLESATPAAPDRWRIVTYVTPESNRRVTDREVSWLERLRDRGAVQSAFNWAFFTSGDSREPELAGIRGALFGSALTLLVTLVLCLPIGVAAAIYLEEFAPKNRLTELIEVNINNLAAVPSIVFGLLGLAMFLNFFGLPRSAPLVGGLVLALLVLPTIIIAARAALKAVPPSIKEAALGVGASQQQAIFHHVLPLAMPGIMTGTIIGMAHALGETAPLLMIGMVAFIVEVPGSITDAATVLPVQIYLWSDLPEIAFQAKTAAAIMVLLVFLFVMNGAAIYLRRQFERRW